MSATITIEANDLYVRRRGNGLARVNFVSVDGSVNYRLVGSRRTYYVKRENFLKNWMPLQETTTNNEGDTHTNERER